MRLSGTSLPSTDLFGKLASALITHSPVGKTTEPNLAAALNTALAQPGRLVRAQLVFQGCLAQNLSEPDALALATAIEYFHHASLLYDDLPCMDNSISRRGRPCLHRTYGEATTILAALALINRAYALIHAAFSKLPTNAQAAGHNCLEAVMGADGIIGGQACDLSFESGAHPKREVLRIAKGKTGALFLLSIYLPALLGQPDANERRALRALCLYWGLGYQVADDLNDVLANSIDTGKTSGRDQMLNRPNLALAIGVPAARLQLAHLFVLSVRALKQLTGTDRWNYLGEFQRSHFEELVRQKGLLDARSAA
jgi:geranylgeranyl pyrophosphate synthase